jgi:pimeloyl-ACP methyl ester carboxylesterase
MYGDPVANFVLVHGGWGGGWEWRSVADLLQQAGHTAYRPTLTGLGERRHLAGPGVDLDTHIDDVRGVLEAEDLTEVLLVGQSYGGMVVTGAADRAADRIRRLIYVDAFVPEDGQSANDLAGEKFAAFVRDLAASDGGGWQVPVWFTGEDLDLPADTTEWYMSHVGPHPLASLEQPVRLTGDLEPVPKTYIDCEPPDAKGWLFRPFADLARSRGWDYRHLPKGHDVQVIDPKALAATLDKIATG